MKTNKTSSPYHPAFPVVDLHRHLDGSVRLQTMLDLARQHGVQLPANTLESLRPHAQIMSTVIDLKDSLPKFALMQSVMVDYDACRRIAYENLEDAVREGIDYIELRFSPMFMAEVHKLDPMGVASAVCEALEEARGRLPVKANLIVIMSRHYAPETYEVELQTALAHRDRGVVAIDIAGVEEMGPGPLFIKQCQKARQAGLHVTVHAGEWSGPQSVRQAVLELDAERIGHAMGAKDDPAVMDLLAERHVAIESCPSSSVQFSMVPSFREYPLPMWLERGLLVTVNTDDPGIQGIDLPHEYRILREELGLSDAQICRLQENGVQAAFITDAERAALLAKKEAEG
jgi:adenosine deaminase